jgi:hypothetical protein
MNGDNALVMWLTLRGIYWKSEVLKPNEQKSHKLPEVGIKRKKNERT